MANTAKNPNSALRLVVVLMLISVITALLLGFVNYITEDRIEEIKLEKTQAALSEVMPGDYVFGEIVTEVSAPEVTHVYSARTEGSDEIVGYVIESVVSGSQGGIDMVVGVDGSGVVTGVAIIDMSETSGLGTKADEPDWRNQFNGVSTEQAVDKDGGEIDALTGATVTSRAVTNGVNIALAVVAELG